MRDEQHRAGERLERRLERLAALEVEVVRRLVEHEQVRARGDDERERETSPLAAREHRDLLLVRLPAGEEEPAEEVLRLRPREPRLGDGHVEDRAAVRQLRLVLGEVRGDDAVAELHAPLVRLPEAEERLEERRLARSVGPDERDVLPPLEHDRGAVEQELVAGGDDEVVRLEHDPAGARGLQELEAERPAPLRHRLELLRGGAPLLLEPPDLAELRLRLLRLRLLVAEPGDEALEPLDVVAHAVELRRRRGGARRLLAPPGVPGAVEEERLRPAELEHGGRDRLEEPAVVRDEHDRRVERRQLALEPLEALHVEVVRRLVEQEEVGVGREGTGERGPRQLSAGERVERPVEVGVAEPEPAEDRRGAIAPRPPARVLEPRLRLAVAAQGRGRVVAARHRLLEPRELLLDRDEVAGAREGVLAEGQPLAARRAAGRAARRACPSRTRARRR